MRLSEVFTWNGRKIDAEVVDAEVERLAVSFRRIGGMLWQAHWYDAERAASWGRIPYHVRFMLYPSEGDQRVAKWSASQPRGYKPMTFEAFVAMQRTGEFPLRVAS
jgi:hypothetical protein